MSSTPTPSVQGTQAPSPIELLWERYKSLAYVLVLAIIGVLGGKYAWKVYSQKQVDESWTSFAATLGIQGIYTDQAKANEGVTEALATVDGSKLKALLQTATDAQKPFVHWAIAKKAVLDKDWAAADAALRDLESKYPNHSLVRSSSHPVQVRDQIKKDEEPKPGKQQPKPEFKPAIAGSAVSMLRAQIESGKAYTAPVQFAKAELPKEGTKVKFDLSGNNGSFTIQFVPGAAPKHQAEFEALAAATPPFWVGLAIDEIRRPAKAVKNPCELHIGFGSTKDDDRTKWSETDPSTKKVEFEKNTLSHFAGAVSARPDADGQSCADRFWIAVDDAPAHDGERVIFAYVVEGLDALKKVCEGAMEKQQDEERGQGRPADVIRVTAVTVIK